MARRLVAHAPGGEWPLGDEVDSVTLAFDDRHRRRIRIVSDAGAELLLDLPRAVALEDGDGLESEDGQWFKVIAAAEPVLEIKATDALHMARLAWHLGNRHTPTELKAHCLRVRQDHVLEAMLRGLGAQTERLVLPFAPERGAYSGGAHHHHHD